jgi:hypothetical protein
MRSPNKTVNRGSPWATSEFDAPDRLAVAVRQRAGPMRKAGQILATRGEGESKGQYPTRVDGTLR